MIRHSGSFALVAALAAAMNAGQAAAAGPPAAPAETVALVGGTVHTVSGPDIEGATVLIDGGKIAAVGREVAVPAGARVVSCEGKHVYPGFVSAVSVLGLVEVGSVRGTDDYQETGTTNPNIRSRTA